MSAQGAECPALPTVAAVVQSMRPICLVLVLRLFVLWCGVVHVIEPYGLLMRYSVRVQGGVNRMGRGVLDGRA